MTFERKRCCEVKNAARDRIWSKNSGDCNANLLWDWFKLDQTPQGMMNWIWADNNLSSFTNLRGASTFCLEPGKFGVSDWHLAEIISFGNRKRKESMTDMLFHSRVAEGCIHSVVSVTHFFRCNTWCPPFKIWNSWLHARQTHNVQNFLSRCFFLLLSEFCRFPQQE
jgi:hypothetical protein